MHPCAFSNAPALDFDDVAETAVSARDAQLRAPRIAAASWHADDATHAVAAAIEMSRELSECEPAPSTRRSGPDSITISYSKTLASPGAPSSRPADAAPEPRESTPFDALSRIPIDRIPVSPGTRIVRATQPVPAQPYPSYRSLTPPAMAIDVPPDVWARVQREMGGRTALRSGRLGAALAAVSLVATLVLGLVLGMPRAGQLRVALSSELGSVARADVLVDGVRRCEVTPCLVQGLSSGTHTVLVRAPGFAPSLELTQTVEAGKERLAFVALEPISAPSSSLRATGPSGVHAFVDGADKGPLPLDLANLAQGQHVVKFEGAAYEPLTQTISVEGGKVRDLGEVHLATRAAPADATPISIP